MKYTAFKTDDITKSLEPGDLLECDDGCWFRLVLKIIDRSIFYIFGESITDIERHCLTLECMQFRTYEDIIQNDSIKIIRGKFKYLLNRTPSNAPAIIERKYRDR